MEGATLSDGTWRNTYKEAVLDAVRAAKPLYLSPGNEVNRWYEQYGAGSDDPNGFQHFVSLYEDIYDAVKYTLFIVHPVRPRRICLWHDYPVHQQRGLFFLVDFLIIIY